MGGRLTAHFQKRCSDIRTNLHKYKSEQAERRCSICQRTASTYRFLGIPQHMGRDMDVGKQRRQSTNQAQPFMAHGRHEVKHTNMGHGRFIRQEKGSRLMWSRMGYILQQNMATSDRHILGEITIGEFIPGRNAWTMFPTPPCQRAFRILSDSGVGSYLVLQQ